jgi:hypothetical protein
MATATHITWKYLFISNTTAPATTRLGTRNRASAHSPRKTRAGVLRLSAAHTASRIGTPKFVR